MAGAQKIGDDRVKTPFQPRYLLSVSHIRLLHPPVNRIRPPKTHKPYHSGGRGTGGWRRET
jgi:hypothetical protein